MGCVPPGRGFLEGLRAITSREKALLIFDEVMTGFRLAFGGAQELYGIQPDLTTMGKIIGGGLPVGAYGGPCEIMDMVAPLGPVYQAGTLSGNPLAMAAGFATLRYLREHKEIYAKLDKLAGELVAGVQRRGERRGRRRLPQSRRIDVHLVLHERPRNRLGFGRKVRHQSLRPLLSRHAGRRNLSAAIAVRSGIPERSAHRARRAANHRSRQASLRSSHARVVSAHFSSFSAVPERMTRKKPVK